MPKGAVILSAIEQYGSIIVYANVDVEQEEVVKRFCVLGTGWDSGNVALESDYYFIGTVKVGAYVWHVFEDATTGWE
jgi:hypothetical protein